MFRTSGFLAIALGVAAIGSAITPAKALPSPIFGNGNSRIAAQLHAALVTTGIQASRETARLLGPVFGGVLPKAPAALARTSIGKAQIPASNLPVGSSTMKQPQIPVSQLPPPSINSHPVDDVCPLDPAKCPPRQPTQKDGNSDKGHGTVVIMAPQVPVAVPAAAPVAVPMHVATAASSAAGTQARPAFTQPSAVSQCGAADTNPELAAAIDELLPTADLSKEEIAKVTELRRMISDLAADGKLAAARNVEEAAMFYFGYQKIWLQCGQGTFVWGPVVYNDAIQSAAQSK